MKNLEKEFYEYLENSNDIERHGFENNWPYILQATRNGLMIERSANSIVYYTKRYPNSPKSPTVVVCALGQDRICRIEELAKREYSIGIETIVKNVDKRDLSYWQEKEFVETTNPWSSYSFRDDNTYPQYNISSKTVLENGYMQDYRRLVRKFDRERNIITESYVPQNAGKASIMLRNFARYSANKGTDDEMEIVRAHEFFFDERIEKKIRLQHIENGQFIGWSFLTPVNEITFYNAIICINETNLMKYLVHQSMNYCATKFHAIKYFGTQGSENEGQNWIKWRLNPSDIIEKTHMIYSPKPC